MKLNFLKLLFFGLIVLLIMGLFLLFKPQSIPILAYHEIKPANEMTKADKTNDLIISLETFEKQMKYLSKNNYKTLTIDQFYCWMLKKCKFPRKSVVITFDDGCRSIYDYVLPILKKYNLNATSFVITSRILSQSEVSDNFNFLTKEMIKEAKIKYKGLEFHSHSHNLHRAKDGIAVINKLDNNNLEIDIQKAAEILNTNIISYPYGTYNDDYIKLLKKNGYIMGFAYNEPFIRARQNDNIYTIPRVKIGGDLNFTRFRIALWYGLFSKNNLSGR
ncbi:MAG: polysaccharide deacetylase family protein [Bacilli bacterium]|nr:polysaccharide deacetylase family protein [Bacilli bacterium]